VYVLCHDVQGRGKTMPGDGSSTVYYRSARLLAFITATCKTNPLDRSTDHNAGDDVAQNHRSIASAFLCISAGLLR
jgi:hypothetical protein